MSVTQGDDNYDGVQYQRDFMPPPGQWQVVDLAWDSFKPNFRGQLVQRPPIRGQQVRKCVVQRVSRTREWSSKGPTS